MAKEFEMFDSWMQSQKEFVETLINTQKELWEQMTESTRKMQEALVNPLCSSAFKTQAGEQGQAEETGQATQKEAFNVYNTMVETMMNSSRVYTDQMIKMQNAWSHTVNKQMEMGRRLNANIFEFGRQAAQETAEKAGETASEMGEQAREEAA